MNFMNPFEVLLYS